MLAARLHGKESLKLEEVSVPQINENEALLRVESAFICGTDVRMFKNGYKNVSPENPLILGHELSGVIKEVGSKVGSLKAGMRVAVAPNMGCGICDLCVSGNTHLCSDYKAFGISIDGGFAEYTRIPQAAIAQGNVVELSDSISFQEAALAEPLSCVYNAFERCDIRPADKVLIIGSGPIGIMHAKLAKSAGASMVIINDLLEDRLEICKQADASFITIAGKDLKDKIMELTSGKGVDVCITACPAPSAQEDSLELMAISGRVLFFGGLPVGTKANLNTNLIHYKQIIVSGTTRASMKQFRKTLELISSGLVEVKSLVTGSFKIDDFELALEKASKGRGLKNEVVFI